VCIALYEQFEKCLDSRVKWAPIAVAHANSVASFHLALSTFISKKFSSNAWQKHKTMLLCATKPFKMSPMQFLTMIHFHNRVLELLPGWPGQNVATVAYNGPACTLSDYEICIVLHQAMPQMYRTKFEDAGKKIAVKATSDVESYYEDQYNHDSAVLQARNQTLRSALANANTRPRTVPGGCSYGQRYDNRPGFRGYTGPGRSYVRSMGNTSEYHGGYGCGGGYSQGNTYGRNISGYNLGQNQAGFQRRLSMVGSSPGHGR
jgi:hypothetical protein